MLVHIKVELVPPESGWYTNHDIVKGSVKSNVKTSTEVTKVNVGLYGVSITHLTRVDDVGQKFTDQVEERVGIINTVQQLFPPPGDQFGTSYSLKPDTYSWPFEFEIPMKSVAFEGGETPPSLSDIDMDTGYIRYYVEADVEYVSSVLRIGSNISSTNHKVPIVFLPTDPEDLDKVSTYGVVHTSFSRVLSSSKTVSGLFSRSVTTFAHDMAKTCTTVALFTARMEFLSTPGSKFSWTLEALPASEEREIRVVGVKVSLKTFTHVRAKNLDTSLERTSVLLDRRQLNLKSGDLTSQLDNSAIILPTNLPPTFKAPNLQREYGLEFRINWTHRKTSNLVHKAVLRKKIWIRSGMQASPNYETGDIIRPNRDFPQEKWYYRI